VLAAEADVLAVLADEEVVQRRLACSDANRRSNETNL